MNYRATTVTKKFEPSLQISIVPISIVPRRYYMTYSEKSSERTGAAGNVLLLNTVVLVSAGKYIYTHIHTYSTYAVIQKVFI